MDFTYFEFLLGFCGVVVFCGLLQCDTVFTLFEQLMRASDLEM